MTWASHLISANSPLSLADYRTNNRLERDTNIVQRQLLICLIKKDFIQTRKRNKEHYFHRLFNSNDRCL